MTDPVSTSLATFKSGLAAHDRAQVNAGARGLIAANAPLGAQWRAVSAALARNGEVDDALAAMDRLVAAAGNSADARFLRAALNAQHGRLEAAQAELGALPSNVPDPAANAYLRGTLALNLGDPVRARAALQQALEANPSSGQAWLALTDIVDVAADPALGRELEDAWAAAPGDPIDRANLAYAVGRKRHATRDYRGAFEAFAAGAELRHAVEPSPSPAPSPWPAQLIARVAEQVTVDHSRVIFVTGLPRSGTTLVEQILASHPDVVGGEEAGLFRLLIQDIGGSDAKAVEAWLERGGEPDRLVELYLHLASQRFGPDGRFVDKTLEASRVMSLLLALFPRAPILWLRRDPIDCGWSAFRTYFARGVGWSWDLGAVGRRLAEEDRLFGHWNAVALERLTVVDYAALVDQPEAETRRIAAASGLSFNPAMLAPHDTERTVTTASVSQVREPINRKGLGVAEPYRAWLGPMIEAYESERPVSDG